MVDNDVRSIVETPDGRLWFGTKSGITHYNPATDEWVTAPLASFSIGNVRDIDINDSNEMVVATSEGVFYRDLNNDNNPFEHWTVEDGLESDDVLSVQWGISDTVWIGYNGSGVTQYSSVESSSLITLTFNWDGLVRNQISTIEANRTAQNMWFGTGGGGGGVSYYQPYNPDVLQTLNTESSSIPHNTIYDILVDPTGAIWFAHGQFSNGLSRLQPNSDWNDASNWDIFTVDQYAQRMIPLLIELGFDDSIWISGTRANYSSVALSQYIVENNNWNNYDAINNCSTSLASIAPSHDGSIWLACGGHGLSHFTPGGDPEITRYIGLDGLPDSVTTLEFDQDGFLWVGTSYGLTRWNPVSKQSDIYPEINPTSAINSELTAVPGEAISYTISVSNQGHRPGDATVVTHTLPVSATFHSASIEPISLDPLTFLIDSVPVSSISGNQSSEIGITITLGAEETRPGDVLTLLTSVSTESPEQYLYNNQSIDTITIVEPIRADLDLTMSGPPQLVSSDNAAESSELFEYQFSVTNLDGLRADNVTVTIDLPAELQMVDQPEPVWTLDTIDPDESVDINFTVAVTNNVPANTPLTVSGIVDTTTPDGDVNNNVASVTIPTTLEETMTLILVNPARLPGNYMSEVYTLATEEHVKGLIVDVQRFPEIADAYTAWDQDVANQDLANDVAEAIKVVIDDYTIQYKNLLYLVIVGGDDVIPYYRVPDQSDTFWKESVYRRNVPKNSTVYEAIKQNQLLTDNFYADREPSTVDSVAWTDDKLLYLPDFAIGRLVESSTEIAQNISSYLSTGGKISLDTIFVGGDERLTYDLAEHVCNKALSSIGQCTKDVNVWQGQVLDQQQGGILGGYHSNHWSQGTLFANDIAQLPALHYEQTLYLSIGCHAGLNVSGSDNIRALDIPQSYVGQGGTMIGSTSYAYGSEHSIAYSEAFILYLIDQLQSSETVLLGNAFSKAKHQYYLEKNGDGGTVGWFDHIDEKVLLPLTLYGLPMTEVYIHDISTSSRSRGVKDPKKRSEPLLETTQIQVRDRGNTTDVTYSFSTTTSSYNLNQITGTGVTTSYYDLDGDLTTQWGMPVQPQASVPISASIGEQTIRGAIMTGTVVYTEIVGFNPYVLDVWAISQANTSRSSLNTMETRWNALPHSVATFESLDYTFNSQASLNLALGLYNEDTQKQRLLNQIDIAVLYSDSDDAVPPSLSSVSITSTNQTGETKFTAQTMDDDIERIVGICDDGESRYETVSLAYDGVEWSGNCSFESTRTRLQIVDTGNNITVSEWEVLGNTLAVSISHIQITNPSLALMVMILTLIGFTCGTYSGILLKH